MQKEAHVLSQLAEVPTMSRAWVREDATDNIMHFTVLLLLIVNPGVDTWLCCKAD